jgi:tRNA splicing ligase
LALEVEGSWTEDPCLIRQSTVCFFKNQFQSSQTARSLLDGVVFHVLTSEENASMTCPFSLEEIEGVIMDCDGNKSPGPDGFNFNFVKSFWSLLKWEVRILFDQFYANASLPKSFSSYFVALIHKVNSPLYLSEYILISLLGCR